MRATGNDDGSSTSPKERQRHSTNVYSKDENDLHPANPPAISLSPQKSSIYNRRLGSNSSRPPILSSPKRRKLDAAQPEPPPRLPAPSPLDQPFSIFNALLQNPELTFEFSKHLPVDDLVSLYAISKDFHFLANRRFTALILGQSVTKAPESSRTFIFTCYRSLCLQDPNRTQLRGMNGMIRTIPSFKWLRMVLFREQMVDDIVGHLYEHGHRLPQRTTLVIKKLWFTLDFSDNVRRVGLVHNEEFWSSKDLFLAMLFFVKLDMRLNDPLTGGGHLGLRRMLLNQRSLSTLARVLQRQEMRRDIDMLRLMVLYNYAPRTTGGEKILGIEPKYVGKLQYEGWGARRTKFIPIDDMIGREGLKRGLQLHHYYMDMMIYGYIDVSRLLQQPQVASNADVIVQKRAFKDVETPPPGTFAEQEYNSMRSSWRPNAPARALEDDDDDEREIYESSEDGDEDEDEDGDSDSEFNERDEDNADSASTQ